MSNWRVTITQADEPEHEEYTMELDERLWDTGVKEMQTMDEVMEYCESLFPGEIVLEIEEQIWQSVYKDDQVDVCL